MGQGRGLKFRFLDYSFREKSSFSWGIRLKTAPMRGESELIPA